MVAACSEERFSRVKQDAGLPIRATRWCLAHAGIAMEQVEAVVWYEKPLLKFERILVSQLLGFPWTLESFRRTAMTWLTDKLWVKNALCKELGIRPERLLFSDHHLSHAASAFYCSPFERAAVLTVDGVGEWASTSLWQGEVGQPLRRLAEVRFPHSLGLVYSAFTAWLGFRVNEGEYKVMGLAAFGQPRFADQVRRVLRPTGDGGFAVDTRYLRYHQSATESYSAAFVDLFGAPRFPGAPLDPTTPEGRRYADVAASVQAVLEEAILALCGALHERTGLTDLCLAGGVALNVVANRRILADSPFRRLYVQPAAGDAGGALGAALWAWREVLGGAPTPAGLVPGMGRPWPDEDLERLLTELHLPFRDCGEELLDHAVEDLRAGRILGWFQGRCEWGPRALGHRSILADPTRPGVQETVNARIKFREAFRPFAPSVAAGAEDRYFDLLPGGQGPAEWMCVVADVKPDARALLPATTHVDGTARLHVVKPQANPRYHALLTRMGQQTGHPVLLNTSFNLKGDPIVATPLHALSTLQASGLDAVYLGRFRVDRRDLPGADS